MEREVWRFRRSLIGLLSDTADQELAGDDGQDFEQGGDSASRHDESWADSHSLPSSNNKILFIGHGQGCWIIKDVLAHQSMDIIPCTYGRTEIQFLDLGIKNATKEAYQTYLKQYWTAFSFGLPSHQQGNTFDQLVSYLQEIDENFVTFANTYSPIDDDDHAINKNDPRPSQTIYQDPNHPVWMADGPLAGPREVSTMRTPTSTLDDSEKVIMLTIHFIATMVRLIALVASTRVTHGWRAASPPRVHSAFLASPPDNRSPTDVAKARVAHVTNISHGGESPVRVANNCVRVLEEVWPESRRPANVT